MSIEALWSITFKSTLGMGGAGVVVIDNGQILGGDAGYTYIGTVESDGKILSATVRVDKYLQSAQSVMGLDNFVLIMRGTHHEDEMMLEGHIVGNPNARIAVHLVRRASLP